MRRRTGFTLIELLIVVVIIGVLASIAIPKFRSTRAKANTAAMQTDLRNLVVAEEQYLESNKQYSGSLDDLNIHPSAGVTIVISDVTAYGWAATATHSAGDPKTCYVHFGAAAPLVADAQEGVASCPP